MKHDNCIVSLRISDDKVSSEKSYLSYKLIQNTIYRYIYKQFHDKVVIDIINYVFSVFIHD